MGRSRGLLPAPRLGPRAGPARAPGLDQARAHLGIEVIAARAGVPLAPRGRRVTGRAMPNAVTSPAVAPILLLLASNVFMTIAWYGHLRFKAVALPTVV